LSNNLGVFIIHLQKFRKITYNKIALSRDSVDLLQREKMKKIQISSFRKKFDDASFQVLKNIVNNSFEKNTTINIAMISRAITDPDVKQKFNSWSSGYDFAVIDFK